MGRVLTDPDPMAASDERAPQPAIIVELDGISVDYRLGGKLIQRGGEILRAVDHVSLTIAKGSTLGLVGGTGSGKTTIGHLLMGMVEPAEGRLLIAGRDVTRLKRNQRREARKGVQLVMQDPYSSLDPRMTVANIISEPLTGGRRLSRAKDRERVAELLGLVGLPPRKAQLYPHQFSGGQRQRIAIARALAPEPDIVVLDEPTSALDVSVRAQILTLLRRLQERLHLSYLVISHDLVSVAFLADEVAVMFAGRIVELGPTTDVYREPRHPYTVRLLTSVPTRTGDFLSAGAMERVVRSTDQPSEVITTGCRYRARCGLSAQLGSPAICSETEPPLVQITPGHVVACHFASQTPMLSGART